MDHTLRAKHEESLSQILAASNIVTSGSKSHVVTPYTVLVAMAREMAKVKGDGTAEPPAHGQSAAHVGGCILTDAAACTAA